MIDFVLVQNMEFFGPRVPGLPHRDGLETSGNPVDRPIWKGQVDSNSGSKFKLETLDRAELLPCLQCAWRHLA